MKFTIHIVLALHFDCMGVHPLTCARTPTHTHSLSDNLHDSVTVSVLRRSNNKAAVECEEYLLEIYPRRRFLQDKATV